MKFIVDIDNTICQTEGSDYVRSTPHKKRIEMLNELYDQGHEIHYWTARGSSSGLDWKEWTETQLKWWGCKFHSVSVGKPSYDVWIDDKAVNPKDFFFDA